MLGIVNQQLNNFMCHCSFHKVSYVHRNSRPGKKHSKLVLVKSSQSKQVSPRIGAQELTLVMNKNVCSIFELEHEFQNSRFYEAFWYHEWKAVTVEVIGLNSEQFFTITYWVIGPQVKDIFAVHFFDIDCDSMHQFIQVQYNLSVKIFWGNAGIVWNPPCSKLNVVFQRDSVILQKCRGLLILTDLLTTLSYTPAEHQVCKGGWGKLSKPETMFGKCGHSNLQLLSFWPKTCWCTPHIARSKIRSTGQ